jgi:hypothetical protein
MEQQVVIKGPMRFVVLALAAVCAWFKFHDYARADLIAGYSGTVVEEGTDYHLLGTPHTHYYIVLRDSTGARRKRYVDYSGYISVKVGTYVVKQPGLGEIPH